MGSSRDGSLAWTSTTQPSASGGPGRLRVRCRPTSSRPKHPELTSSLRRRLKVKVKGVDFIWTLASNVDATSRFYRDVLGLQPTGINDHDRREFQAGSTTLAVTPAHVGLDPPGVLMALAVDDVDAALQEARDAGSRCSTKPATPPPAATP